MKTIWLFFTPFQWTLIAVFLFYFVRAFYDLEGKIKRREHEMAKSSLVGIGLVAVVAILYWYWCF